MAADTTMVGLKNDVHKSAVEVPMSMITYQYIQLVYTALSRRLNSLLMRWNEMRSVKSPYVLRQNAWKK